MTILCPECGAGQHSHCIEQECECECILMTKFAEPLGMSTCAHGIVRTLMDCEQCEQEEQ
jgi:hypothetical protein